MANETDAVSVWLGVPSLSLAWRDSQAARKSLRHLLEDCQECAKAGYLRDYAEKVRRMVEEMDEITQHTEIILRAAHDRMIPPNHDDTAA